MLRRNFHLAAALAALLPCALAQSLALPIHEPPAITLYGNVHPLARPDFDQGLAPIDMPLNRMVLVLNPAAAQPQSLDAFVAAQQDPASPLYRQWLTPAEFGARFGASAASIALAAAWLAAHGFTVDDIPPGHRLIVFSGTAGQVSDAFHCEIHRYLISGVPHIANAQDPQIPASLGGIAAGILSLHDFRRRSAIAAQSPLLPRPLYTAGSTHALFSADFAAIYNLNPLYNAGTTGARVAIAIAARSNLDPADIAQFRAVAGLPSNPPAIVLATEDPGLVAGDRQESTLAAEWSGAIAPAASVRLVVAASSPATDGIDLAAAYAVNHATAPILSLSYSTCEQNMTAAELAFYNSLWEQAAAEGISVFVASGDPGAAGCSLPAGAAGEERAVNGLCTSPYATCVGGTEFNEGANPAQYWSPANSPNYGSALQYIPEEVWNESGANGGSGLWASGGGASILYQQPSWQAGVEGAAAANGMRAVPDVALASAAHDGAVLVLNGSFSIVSGTSVAAPAFAAIMALVVQARNGAAQGCANPSLYALAAAAPYVFHSTPSGSNTVPGVPGFTAAGAAYNLATGLGSVDAAALVARWGLEAAQLCRFRLLPVRCSRPLAPLQPLSQSGSVSISR